MILPLLGLVLARLQYRGGGDWYNDPEVLVNLARFINQNTLLRLEERQEVVSPDDPDIFRYPFIYMTGHGRVHFSREEAQNLRRYLLSGGFLYIDDDYGMDQYIRPEIKKIFPDRELVPVPFSHPIYHILYQFPQGPPKVHEHYPGPPEGYGIFVGGRLVLYYTFNSNVSDGWTEAHGDPPEVRERAFKMGANMVLYALSY